MSESGHVLNFGFWVETFGVLLAVKSDSCALLDLTWDKVRVANWQRLDENPGRSPDLSVHVVSPVSRVDRRFAVEISPDVNQSFVDADSAADLCRTELHLRLAQLAQDFLFVHAGVVQYKGRALIFPGYSNAGKSKLVHSLVSLGCDYLSDEYAVLTREGLVCAFPRPLRLRQPDWKVIPPEQLGWKFTFEPLRVGAIFSLVYRPEADWQISALSQGLTVLELFSHTVDAHARGANALSWLQLACADCTCSMKGARGESAVAAVRIMRAIVSE